MADYSNHFSEGSFWDKISEIEYLGGLVSKARLLFRTWKNPNTPLWVKSLIVGALGYLIFPIDAVPDIIPILGYGDDAGVLTGAVAAICSHCES